MTKNIKSNIKYLFLKLRVIFNYSQLNRQLKDIKKNNKK